MLSTSEIVSRLNGIYQQIPDCVWSHCHTCCGTIIWFSPEEVNIRSFLQQHQLEYVVWSTEEFTQHDMRCPYLRDDRCRIYPVRPIVCRLQGNIPELPCTYHQHSF